MRRLHWSADDKSVKHVHYCHLLAWHAYYSMVSDNFGYVVTCMQAELFCYEFGKCCHVNRAPACPTLSLWRSHVRSMLVHWPHCCYLLFMAVTLSLEREEGAVWFGRHGFWTSVCFLTFDPLLFMKGTGQFSSIAHENLTGQLVTTVNNCQIFVQFEYPGIDP